MGDETVLGCNVQEAADGDDVHEQFQRYCDSMAGSAVWGGQAELGALAHVLRRRIDVFSVGMPTVAMGEEYTGGLSWETRNGAAVCDRSSNTDCCLVSCWPLRWADG